MSVRLSIIAVMKQVAEKRQVNLPSLEDDLSLHETGFDSRALAIPMARLTVGDFVQACENVPA
jgi:hypothetical protein